MSGAHSAPKGGKGRPRACHGTAQVVIGVTMAAGKLRASSPENGLDLTRGAPCASNVRATQRSTMRQSGCGNRCAMRHVALSFGRSGGPAWLCTIFTQGAAHAAGISD